MQGGITMKLRPRPRLPLLVTTLLALLAVVAAPGYPQAGAAANRQSNGLTPEQRRTLLGMAQDAWGFYGYDAGIDANTGLPSDNIGFHGAPPQGNYTSPTNIGVYLWSIVAAADLGLITPHQAQVLIGNNITTVERLRKWNGFLLSWYDTTNGHCVQAPNGADCETGSLDGQIVSNVDDGWY